MLWSSPRCNSYIIAFITVVSAFRPIHNPRFYRIKFLFLSNFDESYSFQSSAGQNAEFEEWGVQRSTTVQGFPDTIDEVVDCAFEAIAGTIYDKCALDPRIASNAMSKSIFTNRPVRRRSDCGRIGIEMDGLRSLFPHDQPMSPGRAMRITTLMLAGKISLNLSWKLFEKGDDHDNDHLSGLSTRPVVVYFNSLKEALLATRSLQELKVGDKKYDYSNVRICCLSDGIPKDFQLHLDKRRVRDGLYNGSVDAKRGICILVQPTDFNSEQIPAMPVVDAIKNFQLVAARASVEQLPMIAISPRFLNSDLVDELRLDQSGYQQSAVYGGIEPPKGPTPWIMRDFTPPVFCWVGSAFALGRAPRVDCKLTRVSLWQTAMEEDHLWHTFVARERKGARGITTDYHYLASTRSASGRPTKQLMMNLLDEYSPV